MAEHVTSWDGILSREERHRERMEEASNRLLLAMFRELEAMEARRG